MTTQLNQHRFPLQMTADPDGILGRIAFLQLEQAELIIEAQKKTLGDIGHHSGTAEGRREMRATVTQLAQKTNTKHACDQLAYPRNSYYRQQQAKLTVTEPRPVPAPSLRALPPAEQDTVRGLLNSERFVDSSPRQIYGTAHDAIEAIFQSICLKAKYVLDADIAQCFDRISHAALLAKLETFPALRRSIRAWLKAGVMEEDQLFPTPAGSPQGGVISPLLANIALHGLETAVSKAHPQARLIRYADDLVVLHKDLPVIEQAKETVSTWLAGMGLEMKPSKTCITHTFHQHDGKVGFDFLGFHVRQYPVGKNRSGKTGYPPNLPLGFKTIIKPSKNAMQRHYQEVKRIIEAHPFTPQAQLISQLNKTIRGWTAYYATVASNSPLCMAPLFPITSSFDFKFKIFKL
jgi:group II intron reverse transcriptase/maturase